MLVSTHITTQVPEGSTYTYAPTSPLRYADGTPVLQAHVETFTCTVDDIGSGTVIRAAVPVLGSSPGMGGSIDADGMLTVPLTAEDTQAIGTDRYQRRRLTFVLETTAGRRLTWEVTFDVVNLAQVSQV